MDLILLQPGDPDILGGANAWVHGGSLVDGKDWGNDFKLGPCIELVSMHQGMKQQVTTDVSNLARTSGRPLVTDFTCVKYVDKVSVKLYDYCLRAKPLGEGAKQPTMLYVMRNSGDTVANILTIALRDAMISEIQLQSHPDDMPTEQFKLNFTEILWTYTVQHADAVAEGNKLQSGWSIAHNRAIGAFTD